MGRLARVIIPGYPHHVIQRGNRRQVVFFSEEDKKLYLKIINYQCRKEKVEIWCYCLMDNHVHLIAVPSSVQSLTKSMSETHRKYTIMINTRENWTGHLWQGRFLSYPMDERHLYLAVRYIERNPVRAGVVKIAEHYTWSSAKAHVENTPDFILSEFYLMSQIKNWRSYLKKEETSEEIELFKSHEKTGRPLGSKVFIAQLETITGRKLRKRRGGRPRKKNR